MKNFEQVLLANQHKLFCFINKKVRNRQATEDIVQDTFVKAIAKISHLKDLKHAKTWLYAIALNEMRETFRKNDLKFKYERQEDTDKIFDIHNYVENKIEFDKIMKHVNNLPEKQKLIFTEIELKDLSIKEVSQKLKMNYDTTKANYRHALLKIRKAYLH